MSIKSTVLRSLFKKDTPETQQTVPLSGQMPNDAGGWVYPVDDWARLDRFLILGTEGGTYYVGEDRLTAENALATRRAIAADGARAVDRIIRISTEGRAAKPDPALFALAMAAASEDVATRTRALDVLPRVARTGTHVLKFAEYVNQTRGWGRGLRRGVARWFTRMPLDRFALQTVKYRQRDGWALRDLLRLAHPLTDEVERRAVFNWLARPDDAEAIAAARSAAPLIDGMYRVREVLNAAEAAEIIQRYSLPREAVPTELLDSAVVWDALLVDMPMTAMIRNLGKMTSVGLLAPGSDVSRYVAERLNEPEQLRAARIHPIQVLLALRTYATGRGFKGGLSWGPVPTVVDALDTAIELTFQSVSPTGKRLLVAVDVSGSMAYWRCNGTPALSPLDAAAAMAVYFLRTEADVEVIGYDTSVHRLSLSRRQRLDDAVSVFQAFGGGTDCALPYQHALSQGRAVDAFVSLTDNETWAGRAHPVEALYAYRKRVNDQARSVVLATTASRGSIVPEADPLSFGIAGFDGAVPKLVGDYLRA